MYDNNYLAYHLRQSSLANSDSVFAKTLDGEVMSYQAFFAGAERLANALIQLGLTPNDRVAVQVDKSLEVLQLYVATILSGGIFLPLNTAYTGAEIEYFLTDASPKIFICNDKTLPVLTPIAANAKVSHIHTLNYDGRGSLIDFANSQTQAFESVERSADDLAAILYTSGTTGRSKGAMLSHKNLWSNGNTLKQTWQFTADDTLIHALPIFHTHGLFVAINVTLAAGSSLIFMPQFNADAIMNAIPDATVLMGVPTFYVRLLQHENLNKDYVNNMRLFVSGSAPLLAETHQQWQEKTGHAILERYGMTETNMNTSNPYNGARKPGTVGMPLNGVEIRITEENTSKELPQGEIGSIEVRGPNVFSGYWQMPEKTKEELRENGFFITGDLGFIDAEGYVSIIGRSKDLIISGGYNVYPKEIELLIDDIDGVNESAVIGLPHPDFGEAVTAVIVLEQSAEKKEQEIKAALADQLAKYKQPKRVFFVKELPRNTMGKVQKKQLREDYAETFSMVAS